MGLALGRKPGRAEVSQAAKGLGQTTKNTAEMLEGKDNETVLKDLGLAKMLRCRVRYFTDGAVIGSKEFVNSAYVNARERFGPKRKDGARAMRGGGSGAKGCCGACATCGWGLTSMAWELEAPLIQDALENKYTCLTVSSRDGTGATGVDSRPRCW